MITFLNQQDSPENSLPSKQRVAGSSPAGPTNHPLESIAFGLRNPAEVCFIKANCSLKRIKNGMLILGAGAMLSSAAELRPTCPAVALPKSTITCTVTATDIGTAAEFEFPGTIQEEVVEIAGKLISCAPNGTDRKCVIFGYNALEIPNGVVLRLTATMPDSGVMTVPILRAEGSTALGNEAPAIAITVSTATIGLNPIDIDLNGIIDNADTARAAQQAAGEMPCTNADLNGDGKCTARDVQSVANAVAGVMQQRRTIEVNKKR
jgi:hypothetical protein